MARGCKMLMAAYLLWFFAILPLMIDASVSSSFANFSSCGTTCDCSHDANRNVLVKCKLPRGNLTSDELNLPPNIYRLNVSGNNFTEVPVYLFQKYPDIVELNIDENNLRNLTSEGVFAGLSSSSLLSLSLQRNDIKSVKSSFFGGLNRLEVLNLGLNNINSWTGNQSRDTPTLEYLDITGTIDWVPDENILALPKLKELRGVTWCKFCPNCTVVNPQNLVNESSRKQKAEECLARFDEMNFLQFGKKDPKRFIKNRFVPECMCVKQSECEFRHVVMPYFKKRTSLPQQLFYMEYVLSPFTILINVLVLFVILTSRSLRKVPSFILIGNTAVVDIIVGIYSIWVANVNISQIDGILEEIMWAGKELQPSTGPIFISGQIISVSISLLLTLERYLAVVYCMKPSMRMTAKGAVFSMVFSWALAIAFALMPVFGVAGLTYNIKRACTPLSYDKEFQSESSVILLASLILIVAFYILNLPLYIQIYRFVKKTGSQVGVKREASLAKKIAILVLTNFIFFAIPIILILIFSIFAEYDSNPFDFEGDAFKSTIFKIAIGQWLPVTCLNINSLLDPFLYAFRHSHFKREIRRKLNRCSGKIFPDFSVSASFTRGEVGSDPASRIKKQSAIEDELAVNRKESK